MTEQNAFTVVLCRVPEESGNRRAALVAAVDACPAADLVVLPYLGAAPIVTRELDRAGHAFAERPPYPTVQAVSHAAARRTMPVAIPFYEVVGEGVLFSTVTIVGGDGTLLGSYRQAHAMNRAGQHEQLFFQLGGGDGVPIFRLGAFRFGVLLGADLWVPEAARLLALAGADVLIASLASAPNVHGPAETLARARALENGCIVVLADRTAENAANVAFGTDGEPLDAGVVANALLIRLDVGEVWRQRRGDDPLRWRRPRLYGGLVHAREGKR